MWRQVTKSHQPNHTHLEAAWHKKKAATCISKVFAVYRSGFSTTRRHTDMNSIRYSQALQGFFLTAQSRKLSPHTIADYENTLIKKFQTFLGRDLLVQEITSDHIQEFLAAQTSVKNKTVLNYHTGLSAFWTWAVREKVAPAQILHGIVPPKADIVDVTPYTESDVRAMLNSLERSKRYSR